MRSRLTSCLSAIAAVATVCIPLTSAFAETILSNDSVGENFNGTTATAELIEGEMYEAVFDIPEFLMGRQLLGVQVVMVEGSMGGEYCAQFGLEVWEEGNAMPQQNSCSLSGIPFANVRSKEPGMNLFSQETDAIDPMTGTPFGFEIKGDPNRGNATIKEMRFSALSQAGLTLFPIYINNNRLRIGVKALSEQCTQGGNIRSGKHPVLLSDTDGVSKPLQNLIYGEPIAFGESLCPDAPKHYAWEDFAPAFANSQPGDWVMRLIVDYDNAPDPDMGMGGDMGADMGMSMDTGMSSLDAGGDEDMGSGPSDTGGNNNGNNNGTNNANNNGTNNNNASNNNNGTGAILAIESITPEDGANDASVNVVILGEGFQAGAEVLLDADAIGVTETKAERIRATVPEGLNPGTYDVIVTNPDGASAILRDGYTVREAGASGGGGSNKGASSDGCCAQAPGTGASSSPGLGIVALLFAFSFVTRRRRRAP